MTVEHIMAGLQQARNAALQFGQFLHSGEARRARICLETA
jgi:lysozyme family protein